MIKYKVLIVSQSRLNYFSKEVHNLKIKIEKNKDLKADWTLVRLKYILHIGNTFFYLLICPKIHGNKQHKAEKYKTHFY